MGAVVAAAAAARRKRTNFILDTFRIAGATSIDRSRRLSSLGVEQNSEFDALVRDAVLVHEPRDDTWYLDEAAYVRWREGSSRTEVKALLLIVLAIGALLLALTVWRTTAQ